VQDGCLTTERSVGAVSAAELQQEIGRNEEGLQYLLAIADAGMAVLSACTGSDEGEGCVWESIFAGWWG
jgi:hypothetical protein